MIYVVAIGLILSVLLSIYQSLKIKRLVTALAATNTSLNETRSEVATLLKWRKLVISKKLY